MSFAGSRPAYAPEVVMKKIAIFLATIVAIATALPTAQPAGGPDITLVLLIAVDQFRFDYLTRFRTDYTDGFKRLLTQVGEVS